LSNKASIVAFEYSGLLVFVLLQEHSRALPRQDVELPVDLGQRLHKDYSGTIRKNYLQMPAQRFG
jgi:hypothetical protein